MQHVRWKILVFGALLFLLGTAQAQTFRIAVGVDPDTLDPVQGTTTTVDNIMDYMVQTLVTIDQEGSVLPLLATSWEVSEDGLSVTLNLREGVVFHDGTPLTAEVVKWNLERLLDPEVRVPRRAPYTAIETVEAVDPLTVRLTLSQPAPALIAALSQTTSAMISPNSIGQNGNTYKNIVHPVGTGPYTFTSRTPNASLVVDRFEDYWGEKPYYQTVEFRIVPEATTREALLLAGQVDLMILPPASDLPALKANPAVEVLLAPSDRTIFIALNNQLEPLTDKRVRQALNYAVDKQAIIEGILFGAADAMDAPMAASLFGYEKIGGYEYNPEKAKALLAEAGIPEGTELEMIAPTGRYLQDFQAAQAIAGFLRDVGLEVSVNTMDWPTYIATITKPVEENQMQMHLLGWAPAFLDASQQMVQFWSERWPPNGLATSFYKNEKVDELIVAAAEEPNPEKRAELYAEASRLIWEDAPWIFLWVQRFPIVYDADIAGVSSLPNEKFQAIYAHPAE